MEVVVWTFHYYPQNHNNFYDDKLDLIFFTLTTEIVKLN